MDRYAIFVDAGYFFAAGSNAVFGNSPQRKQITIKSPATMLEQLRLKADLITKNPHFLRTYWYDAIPGQQLSLEQSTLAMLSGVKLRLGAINNAGKQKGVDSLIVTDLIDLARNNAISDAVMVTGDGDLRVAIQVAQSYGVRVHILATHDPKENVSTSLQMEADSVESLGTDWFREHLELRQTTLDSAAITEKPTSETDEIETIAEVVANTILKTITEDELTRLVPHFAATKNVPPEYDTPLIKGVSDQISRRLTPGECRHVRGIFIRITRNHR